MVTNKYEEASRLVTSWDFPVVKTLPLQGARVQPLVRELRSLILAVRLGDKKM